MEHPVAPSQNKNLTRPFCIQPSYPPPRFYKMGGGGGEGERGLHFRACGCVKKVKVDVFCVRGGGEGREVKEGKLFSLSYLV